MQSGKYKSDDQSQLFLTKILDKSGATLGVEIRRFPKTINAIGEEVFEFSLGDQIFPDTSLRLLTDMRYRKIDSANHLGLVKKR